jgi:hypothetical protein
MYSFLAKRVLLTNFLVRLDKLLDLDQDDTLLPNGAEAFESKLTFLATVASEDFEFLMQSVHMYFRKHPDISKEIRHVLQSRQQ